MTLDSFPAGANVAISCRDSVNRGGFYTFSMRTDGSGHGFVNNQCYSGYGPDHWVIAGGAHESNHVQWGPGSSPPPPPPPTPPPAGSLRIYNKVTNGTTAMREDTSPAYLSTVTRNYCRSNGCMIAGTERWTGDLISTVVCQQAGDRTTNGQDNSPIDDQNPGLYTSTLWYGLRLSSGQIGYISEVWIDPSQRGGSGLPSCATALYPPGTLVVYNKVTNGSTQMREDSSPAYLGTVPRNYCRRDGCMIGGTERFTGGTFAPVVCYVNGERTTNGDDTSSIDDNNPGLYTSTLWYGVRQGNGSLGYVSEVWIDPSQRHGFGQPPCGSSAPSTPRTVAATAGDGAADVSWTPPASDGGGSIWGYTVVASPGGLTATAPGDATSARVDGLIDGTAYTFTVRANNLVGTSESSSSSALVTPAGPPDAPRGVTAVAGDASAVVSWDPPPNNGGAPVSDYTVTSWPDLVTVTAPPGATSATVAGLTPGVAYEFNVVAENWAGPSDSAAQSNAVTPGAPGVLARAVQDEPTIDRSRRADEDELSERLVDFDEVSVQSASPLRTVTLTNTGSAALTVTAVQLAGDNASEFRISSQTCTAVSPMAPSATCTINIEARPQTSGDKVADVIVDGDGAGSPHFVELAATATGGPTNVELLSLEARRLRGGGVKLTWRTGSEVGVAGFHVYQGTRRATTRIIPAHGVLRGHRYHFIDRRVTRPSSQPFRLQAVTQSGHRHWVGPPVVPR